ncbi:hypothetical protein TruAng_002773 [Truncatella angustata]|nr:hypothetical protein TruAng_002773 [Truncatella angustata]
MATFKPVNIEVHKEESMATSPTTPTPTRATFSQNHAQQRPLPTSPFPQTVQIPESIDENKTLPQREDSQRSKRTRAESEDVGMDDSDGDDNGEDGSDDESVNADGTKSNKKKKSQRFYCTDYPPCNLSFTRSEHLARHIRLENILENHAQTVHVNEDIPIDSLAATGTRFQRQIRTDRVRQPGRARSSTASSIGPGRGHGKSLSTSSITSINSNFGAPREDIRRRPPPLVMADPQSRLSFESYQSTNSQYSYRPVSPSDFSTPTSATFSTGQSSPKWGSGIASPTTAHARSHSMYAGSRTPGRRLSVPSSAGNPFQSPHGANTGRPLFGPGPISGSGPGALSPSISVVASPTSSIFSRRDSITSAADEAWRRRTWHPDSSNFAATNASSRLSNVITPSQFQSPVSGPLPIADPTSQSNNVRLPGIESFDPLPLRQPSPLKRNPSPMMIDSEPLRQTALQPVREHVEERPTTANWDMGLHRGLTRLDLASNTTPPRDSAGAWAQEVQQAVEAEANRVKLDPPTVRFNEHVTVTGPPSVSAPRIFHQHTMSAPMVSYSRENKRHGWYHGPVTVHSEARPEKMARVERMVHPNISHFSGFPARNQPPPQEQPRAEATGDRDNMLRLQALVAVATSENSATTAY